MKITELKLNETSIEIYDDFVYDINKKDNLQIFENMMSIVLSNLLSVK